MIEAIARRDEQAVSAKTGTIASAARPNMRRFFFTKTPLNAVMTSVVRSTGRPLGDGISKNPRVLARSSLSEINEHVTDLS